MSAHSSDNATHSTTTIPNWSRLPCVQYGFAGHKRDPILRTIFEPVPENAETASPIYLLSREEYDDQYSRENGYAVKGPGSIATKLQTQREEDQNVLYPIHIESDELLEEGPETLIEWFREFTEDHLDCPLHTCTLYSSGNRSIHVHVPRFVTGEVDREHLKALAETFCEETGAKLDCGLYGRKRMFRLPGVQHAKTGLHKVEIQPDWSHTRIVRESTTVPGLPESYAALLQHVYVSQQPLTTESEWDHRNNPLSVFRVLDSEKTIIQFTPDTRVVETPLIERRTLPEDATFEEKKRWWMYNAKEFSPYALATGGSRSVAVLKVMGTPFARREVTIGNRPDPVHALVPAYFYGARGCAGGEFTKDHEHAPLQLSKLDYPKWNYNPGDHVVLIGGKNGQAIIHGVDPTQAHALGDTLTGENASREAALEYLRGEGYDVGQAGTSEKATAAKRAGTRRRRDTVPTVRTPRTEAAALQQQAEQSGIHTLTHDERRQLSFRVLKWGWDPAWGWFKRQFGAEFKPDVTWREFNSAVMSKPEWYPHVEVPPRPR